MVLKQNEKGEFVLTQVELAAAFDEVADAASKAIVEKAQLNRAAAPPVQASPEAIAEKEKAKSLLIVPADESLGAKQMRINEVAREIKLGHLRVCEAPKELKMMEFVRAQARKDTAVIREIGEYGWPEKTLTEGSATDGGNLVPIEFATDLKVALETYGAIGDCSRHDMISNEKDLRSVTTKPVIYQVNETVAPTASATKFGKPQLIAKAFAGLQVMSIEEFQDNNVGLYAKLLAMFAEQFSARQSHELFNGTTFSGLLSIAGTLATTLESTSILETGYAKLVAMTTSLSPGQLSNGGKWYMHRTVFGAIGSMEDDNGRPIILNPWDAKQRTLLGYPVTLDESMPGTAADAADKGFIAFGNLMWANFGMRQEIRSQLLTEATVASVNLAEQRCYGLLLDTRWGTLISQPGNLAVLKTKA